MENGSLYNPPNDPVVSCYRMDPTTGILALDTGIGTGGLVTCSKVPGIDTGSWYASVFVGSADFDRYVFIASYNSSDDTVTLRQTEQLFLSSELELLTDMESALPKSFDTTVLSPVT